MHLLEYEVFEADPELSPETNETIRLVQGQLLAAQDEILRQVKVTADMPERMMLQVLDARFGESREAADELTRKISEAGGPNENRLHRYLYDVLYRGMSRRIDARVRDALLMIDQGIKPGTVPRATGFHPGTPTPYLRRLVAKEAIKRAQDEADKEEWAAIAAGWYWELERLEHYGGNPPSDYD